MGGLGKTIVHVFNLFGNVNAKYKRGGGGENFENPKFKTFLKCMVERFSHKKIIITLEVFAKGMVQKFKISLVWSFYITLTPPSPFYQKGIVQQKIEIFKGVYLLYDDNIKLTIFNTW